MAINLPYSFVPGTLIRSTEVNANFDSLNNRTQWVTPEMFGAKGDGVTDDTVAVQASTNSFSGRAGTVFLTNTYGISDTITIPSYVSIKGFSPDFYTLGTGVEPGTGSGVVVLSSNISSMAGKCVFDVTDTRYVTISDLTIKVEVIDPANNTISGIRGTGSESFLLINRNRLRGFGGNTIHITGSVNTITSNRFNGCGSNGIYLHDSADNHILFNDGGDHYLNNTAPFTPSTVAGIYIHGGGNMTIIGNCIYNSGVGLLLDNYSTGHRIEGNRFEKHSWCGIKVLGPSGINMPGNMVIGNHIFNCGYANPGGYNTQGIVVDGSVRDQIVSNKIANQTANPGGTNLGRGIQVSGASSYILISNNMIYDVKQEGIAIDSSTQCLVNSNYLQTIGADGIAISNSSNDTQITNNKIVAASQNSNNMYNTITVNDASRIHISNNTAKHADYANKPKNAVYVNSGSDTVTVINNDFVNSTYNRGEIFIAGTNAEIRDNRGFATYNSGEATVAPGTTSCTVTHSLAVTPSAKHINVTPTNNIGAASKYWVSNVGAFTFDINVDTNPGAGTATFAWSAEYIR